jgi:hypothetical protein
MVVNMVIGISSKFPRSSAFVLLKAGTLIWTSTCLDPKLRLGDPLFGKRYNN